PLTSWRRVLAYQKPRLDRRMVDRGDGADHAGVLAGIRGRGTNLEHGKHDDGAHRDLKIRHARGLYEATSLAQSQPISLTGYRHHAGIVFEIGKTSEANRGHYVLNSRVP